MFARQIQVIAAASTSVGPAEHKPQNTTQILVQGNAVADIAKLLLGNNMAVQLVILYIDNNNSIATNTLNRFIYFFGNDI